MTPEGKVKGRLKKLLDSYGERIYYLMVVPSGYGKQTVDFLICVDGLFVAVEAKRPDGDGQPTARQEQTLEDVRAAGGSTFVVYDDRSFEVFSMFLRSVTEWG